MTDQFDSISIGRKVDGTSLSMDTGSAPDSYTVAPLRRRLPLTKQA